MCVYTFYICQMLYKGLSITLDFSKQIYNEISNEKPERLCHGHI